MNFLSILIYSTIGWSNPVIDSNLIISDVQLECQMESDLIDSLILNGRKLMGTPYKYGGNSAKGIDCSGLVHYIFGSMGADVARTSRDLSTLGYKVDMDQISKGDLVFFKGRNVNSTTVGHVAYVISGAGKEMVILHATSKGVITEKIIDTEYYQKRFLFAKRIEYDEMFEML